MYQCETTFLCYFNKYKNILCLVLRIIWQNIHELQYNIDQQIALGCYLHNVIKLRCLIIVLHIIVSSWVSRVTQIISLCELILADWGQMTYTVLFVRFFFDDCVVSTRHYHQSQVTRLKTLTLLFCELLWCIFFYHVRLRNVSPSGKTVILLLLGTAFQLVFFIFHQVFTVCIRFQHFKDFRIKHH